jgi:predicted ester cyclase
MTPCEAYPSTESATLAVALYSGCAVFNKEKREQRKAVKEELKLQIQPRPTFQQKTERRARRLNREAREEDRHMAVKERLEALHTGTAEENVVQFGSDLLYVEGLSDIKLTMQDQFTQKDRCAARWTVYARHDKDFLGMPPTGRDVNFTGASVCIVDEENKVTQEFHYWDMVALLQQIQAP